MPTCAFCNTTATELSGEHIWDDWLNRALPKTKYRVRQRTSMLGPFREYETRVLKEKLPVVCDKCNSGWMSTITNQTKQTFSDSIINGAPMLLVPEPATLLAAFTFMKSVVADCGIKDKEPFFPKSTREKFKEILAIPPEVQMWIAAYQRLLSLQWQMYKMAP